MPDEPTAPVVHKFPLDENAERQTLTVPGLIRPLSVGEDPSGTLCLWALVNPALARKKLEVRIVGTGNDADLDADLDTFLTTVVTGPFVWHVFTRSVA